MGRLSSCLQTSGCGWHHVCLSICISIGLVLAGWAIVAAAAHCPPQIGIAPRALQASQIVNDQTTQSLVISNSGGAVLFYSLEVFFGSPQPAPQLLVEPPPHDQAAGHWRRQQAMPQVIPSTAVFTTTLFPILSDPLGDGGPADVIDVLAGHTNTAVIIQLLFAPNVIPENVWGYILLDIDQDPETGGDPCDWYGWPTHDIGIEYCVSLFGAPDAFHVYHHTGLPVGSITPIYETDSVLFAIPLSILGNDDGHLNLAMALGGSVGPTEWVPDTGHGVIGDATLPVWLTFQPASGSISSGDSQIITVTFDSAGLQPHQYPATLRVSSNDPVNHLVKVPSCLTVEPTASMGWVEGYVIDGRFRRPVQATIKAEGQPYTIKANADGYYKLWLEAGEYELHVSAAGYVRQQQPISIVAHHGQTSHINMVQDIPIFNLSTDSLTISQQAGDVTATTIYLENSGPAAMSFQIHERNAAAQSPPTQSPGATNLVTWIAYTAYYWEYHNTLNAIAQYAIFNLTETDTEDPVELAALLAMADVLLIPEQQFADSNQLFALGQSWSRALQDFVTNGGTIVLLDHCHQTFQLLQGAGLVNMQLDYCSSHQMLEVVNAQHPLLWNVSTSFYGRDGIAFYTIDDGEALVRLPSSDNTVAMAKEINAGRVVVIGFDFFSYNQTMARLLANAVQWYDHNLPWLSTRPVTGTIAGYDALPVTITLDASELPPGLYTAQLVVNSNDPYKPFAAMTLDFIVQPAALVPSHELYLPIVVRQ